LLCEDGQYTITRVQPADFFPQTAHVEAVAFLVRSHLDRNTESLTKTQNSNS